MVSALGVAGRWWKRLGADRRVAQRDELLAQFRLGDVAARKVGSSPYGKQRLLEIAMALAANRACCCSTNRWPAFPAPSAARSSKPSPRSGDVSVLLIGTTWTSCSGSLGG